MLFRSQDLSFHVHLPTKKIGTFSIFGFGGNSEQNSAAVSDSIEWTNNPSKRSGWLNAAKTGMLGITHSISLGKKTFIKTIISANGYQYREDNNRLDKFNGPLIYTRNNTFSEVNGIASVVITHKFNSRHILRAGAYTTGKSFDLAQRETVSNLLRDKVKSSGDTRLTNEIGRAHV